MELVVIFLVTMVALVALGHRAEVRDRRLRYLEYKRRMEAYVEAELADFAKFAAAFSGLAVVIDDVSRQFQEFAIATAIDVFGDDSEPVTVIRVTGPDDDGETFYVDTDSDWNREGE